MAIRHIRSLKEHDDLLELKKDTLVVLDFHATWCGEHCLAYRKNMDWTGLSVGPCHTIAPVFEQMSRDHPQLAFAKVDVDAVTDVAQKYRISAMPTFLFIRNKTVLETVRLVLRCILAQSNVGVAASRSRYSRINSIGDEAFIWPARVRVKPWRRGFQGRCKQVVQVQSLLSYLPQDVSTWIHRHSAT